LIPIGGTITNLIYLFLASSAKELLITKQLVFARCSFLGYYKLSRLGRWQVNTSCKSPKIMFR